MDVFASSEVVYEDVCGPTGRCIPFEYDLALVWRTQPCSLVASAFSSKNVAIADASARWLPSLSATFVIRLQQRFARTSRRGFCQTIPERLKT